MDHKLTFFSNSTCTITYSMVLVNFTYTLQQHMHSAHTKDMCDNIKKKKYQQWGRLLFILPCRKQYQQQ